MTGFGIALVLVGGVLIVAEAHLPTGGVLGVAGVLGLVGGTVLALDAAGAALALVLVAAVLLAVVAGAALLFAGRRTLEVSRRRPTTGAEGLVGHLGIVRRTPQPVGQVLVDGALWRARLSWTHEEDEPPPAAGEPVVVERVRGLELCVRRAEEWEVHP
jgi:membrane-bound ClpP family serine protease